MEGDRSGKLSNSQIHISIHSLRMEGDIYRMLRIQNKIISIHSLRMEGDPDTTTEVQTTEYFNPLPPHGGRRQVLAAVCLFQDISIHSLRMEGDIVMRVGFGYSAFISIHSLRMEGD